MRKRMRKRSQVMFNESKNIVKTGVVSMAGMGVMGAMSGMAPGSGPIVSTVGSGLALANVGQMLSSGKKIGKNFFKV